jgi:uncharacterized protein YneF (UPF0154 family)
MVGSGQSFHLQLRHAATVAAAALLFVLTSFVPLGPAAAQTGGMSQRQIMKTLGPMMQDEDFNEKLEEFAEEHNLDPDMLRAMIARQKSGKGGKLSQRQIIRTLRPMMQDEDFNEKLEEFAEEHDLYPDMLRAMMAKQGGRGSTRQLQQYMRQ